jgi:hypothetical protein
MINEIRNIEGLKPLKRRPRVAIAMPPAGTARSLRLAYSWGYTNDPDEGLTLPIESSFVGRAWKNDRSYYSDLEDPAWEDLLSRPEDQSLRRMVSRRMAWSFTTTYTRKGLPEKRIVVAVDGSPQIGITEALRDKVLLVALGGAIKRVLDKGVPQEFYDGWRFD